MTRLGTAKVTSVKNIGTTLQSEREISFVVVIDALDA